MLDMARTVRDKNLGSRTQRAELKRSGKPYYRTLDEGLHLGYRKNKDSGKWVVRSYDKEARTYAVETLPGVADDQADADGNKVLSFSQAQRKARQHHAKLQQEKAAPSLAERYTVGNAIDAYLKFLEAKRRSVSDARSRANAFILPEFQGITVVDLTKDMLQGWLERLADQRPRVRTREGEAQKYREIENGDPGEARRRRESSANRTWTYFKAALNQAWRDRKEITDDSPWRKVTPFEDVEAARPRWLNNDESRRFINAAQGDFRKTRPGSAPHWRRLRDAGRP
jgi:hypothetical protein